MRQIWAKILARGKVGFIDLIDKSSGHDQLFVRGIYVGEDDFLVAKVLLCIAVGLPMTNILCLFSSRFAASPDPCNGANDKLGNGSGGSCGDLKRIKLGGAKVG